MVPGITLEGVTKRYPGGVEAVSDVSLLVENGEFVTLVGPSGCGKTTTLRTIAGFEQPTSGVVGINGETVTTHPPDVRDTGMVFQDFALFPHMTVAENVAYGLRVQGWDDEAIEARVQEMLELVELPGTADRLPGQLSGGQQQRIAFARAVAPEPSVLLLDEPLASLDKNLRETMQVELRRIQQQLGITTLLVTHNQKEALTMSDRVVVMNDGEFEQIGTPQEVYSRPVSPFVADFVGTANLLKGTVVDVNDSHVAVDCDAVTVQSADTAGADLGDDVTVVTRPEHVNVAAGDVATDGGLGAANESDEPTGAETVIDGVVQLAQYNGDQIEYHVETVLDESIISVERVGVTDANTGDAVQLRLPAADCRILTDS